MKQHIVSALTESQTALENLISNEATLESIQQAAQTLIDTFNNNGRVFSCGNGGSMSDSMHFSEELSGRYRKNRKGLPATAISDPGHITCVGNDYGYEYIFSRYIEAHGRKGDTLFAISTSGTSANVIKATEYAQSIGMNVITLTGKEESKLGKLATVDVCTPGGNFADRVQELHIKVIHILIELIEREYFPENY